MCCVPGEGDEDEEEDEDKEDGSKPKEKIDMSLPGAGRSKYVNGKAGFAFDPSKFQ
jgi:hypothetical protein